MCRGDEEDKETCSIFIKKRFDLFGFRLQFTRFTECELRIFSKVPNRLEISR